ncbi:threonylcarbamoyl-AMP synthase [Candidatus Woesearchaeota archaeon]|nr:MAG: threonylcarbamoyl-AMP synthase [Candidatus Woesearchaeota archaeon]
MRIITKEEFILNVRKYVKTLKSDIFIYPTDTIYGIGCDATNEDLVKKIRKIKQTEKPFSIIAPSMEWIYEHCILNEQAKEWLKKLPGPYTIILPLKNHKELAGNISDGKTIGIRIPKHWFSKVVAMIDTPIVTTSANVTGEMFMTDLENLDKRMEKGVQFAIYEGKKAGNPSTLVHIEEGEVKIKERK